MDHRKDKNINGPHLLIFTTTSHHMDQQTTVHPRPYPTTERMSNDRDLKPPGTAIHITALDGIINSIFTFAVFVGLAWSPNDPSKTLNTDPSCSSLYTSVAENLVAFQVYSFSSFLFSSLVAVGLKQAFRISVHHDPDWAFIHTAALRLGMLVSAVGSFSGCAFLMLALINFSQIKLGSLSCGSSYTYAAVIPLVILVPSALLIYIAFVFYAFTR